MVGIPTLTGQICPEESRERVLEIWELPGVLYKEEDLVRLETAEKEPEHLQCWEEWGDQFGWREISCESRLPGTGRSVSDYGCGEWECSLGEDWSLTLGKRDGLEAVYWMCVGWVWTSNGVGWLAWVERQRASDFCGRLGDHPLTHFNGLFVPMAFKFLLLSFLPFVESRVLFQCGLNGCEFFRPWLVLGACDSYRYIANFMCITFTFWCA